MPFPIAGSLHSMKNHIPQGHSPTWHFSLSHCSLECLWHRYALSSSPAWRPGPVQPDPNGMLLSSEWMPSLTGLYLPPRRSWALWPAQHVSRSSMMTSAAAKHYFSCIILSDYPKGKTKKSFKNAACALPVQQRISWKSFIFLNDIIMYALFCFHHFYHHFLAEAQVTWLG